MSTTDDVDTPIRGRKLELEDLFRLRTITDARLSPDGATVAYVLRSARPERNEYTSSIWLLSTEEGRIDGGERQVCGGDYRARAPRWSPDGNRLAFVSDESGKPQIYVVGVHGGEAQQLTDLDHGADGPVWSPDGRRLAFVSSETAGSGAGTDTRVEYLGKGIRRITRLTYRFDARGDVEGRFNHVWVVDAQGGNPLQLTSGDQDDVMPAWSPDGRRIVFVSNRVNEADTALCSQLYVMPAPEVIAADVVEADTGVTLTPVSGGTEWATAPVWHPDGARIAFIGRRAGAPPGANNHVYVVLAGGDGEARSITETFDRSPGTSTFGDTWSASSAPPDLFWGPRGDSLYFTACDRGAVSLYRADTGGKVERVVGGDRTVGLVSRSAAGDQVAYVAGDFTNPCDLYTAGPDGAEERRLTSVNSSALSALNLREAETFSLPGPGGGPEVSGWLVRPAGYTEGQRYPLVQLIHGGPHSVFGHTFFFDVQLWASEGWNVLLVNPRGSQGYGDEFATLNTGNWGAGDWPEQEAALDLAIARGGVDPDRLGVTGLSYGGFMTNWIVGHTTRYRAAVSENGICNLVSFYGTSDIGWHWLEHELRGPIWKQLDFYMEFSPISYVGRVETPVLLLQAESDWRCPIEQGEQFYTALRARGLPCEMVRFPEESHVFLREGRPASRLERRRHTLRWFRRYLNDAPA